MPTTAYAVRRRTNLDAAPRKCRPIPDTRGPRDAAGRPGVAAAGSPPVGVSATRQPFWFRRLLRRPWTVPPAGAAADGARLPGRSARPSRRIDALERQAREAGRGLPAGAVRGGRPPAWRTWCRAHRRCSGSRRWPPHATGTDVAHALRGTTGCPAGRADADCAVDLLIGAPARRRTGAALAATLDDEFSRALGVWRAVFEALGSFCHDSGPGGQRGMTDR